MEATLVLSPAMLGNDLAAIARARRWVRGFLDERHATNPELTASAILVVSELVTNAIVHAHATPHVVVAVRPERVTVVVDDPGTDDDAVHIQAAPLPPERVGGHGLAIVGHVANRWGVEPTTDSVPNGKRVWAEFDLTAPRV